MRRRCRLMKIGLILNMANNQWLIAKALRRLGVDAELVLSAKDFGMAFPHWEEADIPGMDPYEIDVAELSRYYSLPDWVRLWNPRDLHVRPENVIDLLYMAKEYDLLQLSAPSVIYLQFMGKKFIVHEAGWIRNFAFRDGAAEKLARRGYDKAQCVVMTNPDCYALLEKIKYRKAVFIPFVVETERYRPMQVDRDSVLTFLHPTRHLWNGKGNDRLLRAFSKFIHQGYDARLVMMNWGTSEDINQSRRLVQELQIDRNVEWLDPVSKPRLIQLYNRSDAVFDQFMVGSYGTTAIEAMACARPVVMYLEKYWNTKCYGEVAPVLNAQTADEIFGAMVALTDERYRQKVGLDARNYVIKHHGPEVIAKKYMQLYREVLE